jgi:nitrite reductase/ring-hydroxylating ferredoxin subunit/uncharacterized membrane protein
VQQAVIKAIEEASFIDPVAVSVARKTAKLYPGKVKDVVSGTWLGHPVHPLLTDLPIGFWIGSLILDLLGGKKGRKTADKLVLAGILAAVPTAYTGSSDWADCRGKEMRVGAAHALSNVGAVLLFTGSYRARKKGERARGLRLSFLGAGALSVGGYLGGHLAYRLGVGVDQTVFQSPPEEWTAVATEDDLLADTPLKVSVEGAPVLLYRSGSEIFAIANRCSHRGGRLHEGKIDQFASTVTCPLHYSTFSLRTGEVVNGPATAPQPSYDARIQAGQVQVRPRMSERS